MSKDKLTQCNFYALEKCVALKKPKTVGNQTVRRKLNIKSVGTQYLRSILEKSVGTQYCNTVAEKPPKLIKEEILNPIAVALAPPLITKHVEVQTDNVPKTPVTPCFCTTTRCVLQKTNSELISLVVNKCEVLGLSYQYRVTIRGDVTLTLTNPALYGIVDFDYDIVKAVVTSTGNCQIFIIFQSVQTENLMLDNEILVAKLDEVLRKIKGENYAFCPGVKDTESENLCVLIVKRLEYPFKRSQSVLCLVWYEKPVPKKVQTSRCNFCLQLTNTLQVRRKRKARETPEAILERTDPKSTVPISNLPREFQKIRLKRMRNEKRALLSRVKKLEKQLEHKNKLLGISTEKRIVKQFDYNINFDQDEFDE